MIIQTHSLLLPYMCSTAEHTKRRERHARGAEGLRARPRARRREHSQEIARSTSDEISTSRTAVLSLYLARFLLGMMCSAGRTAVAAVLAPPRRGRTQKERCWIGQDGYEWAYLAVWGHQNNGHASACGICNIPSYQGTRLTVRVLCLFVCL